jgi:hypothetical protein
MNEKDELNRLYHDAERSLMRRFLTEHEVFRGGRSSAGSRRHR